MYFEEDSQGVLDDPNKKIRDHLLMKDAQDMGTDATDSISIADALAEAQRRDLEKRQTLASLGVADNATRGASMVAQWKAKKDLVDSGLENHPWMQADAYKDSMYNTDSAPETDSLFVGTTMQESTMAQPGAASTQMRRAVYDHTKMQRGTEAAIESLERFAHKQDEKLTPDVATELARELGADVKFDKPVTEFHVRQSAEKYNQKKLLEEQIALYDGYRTDSRSLWDSAMILGAGLAGGFDPAEAAVSTAAAILMPAAILKTIGGGAKLLSNALKTKKVMDTVLKAKTINTQFDLYKAMSSSAKVSLDLSKAESIEDAVLLYKNAGASAQLPSLVKNYTKFQNALQKAQGINYESLGGLGKGVLDSAAYLSVDAQIIRGNLANSKELGVDIYTEKDAAMDLLGAGVLGVVLPFAVRGIGRKLGFTPAELRRRRLDNLEADVKTQKALGEISDAEADLTLESIAHARDIENKILNHYKKPNKALDKIIDDIQRMNTTSETYLAQQAFVLKELIKGNVPRLHMIPSFEQLFSNVDARLIGRLVGESASQVFGSQLMTDVAKGVTKVNINGDLGLLGKSPVTGLNARTATRDLENLYKGLVLRDEEAFKRYWDSAAKLSTVSEELRALTQLDSAKIYKADLEKLRNAFISYNLESDVADSVLEELDSLRVSDMLGETFDLSESAKQALTDFDEWFASFTKDVSSKQGGKYKVFVGINGRADKGRSVLDFLDSLDDSVTDNMALGSLDDMLQEYVYNPDAMQAAIKALEQGDITAEDTLNKLFGVQRIMFDDFKDKIKAHTRWDSERSLRTMEYKQMMADKDEARVVSWLRNFSNTSAEVDSRVNRLMDSIDSLELLKRTDYTEVRNNVKQLFNSQEFRDMLISTKLSPDRALYKAVRNVLKSVIETNDVLRRAITDISEITDSVMEVFEAEANKSNILSKLDDVDTQARPEYVPSQAISNEALAEYELKTSRLDTSDLPEESAPDYAKLYSLTNKEGKSVATYAVKDNEELAVELMNTGVEKGAARKLVAKLLQQDPNRKFTWDAINPASRESYRHFVEEFPQYKDRVIFTDKNAIDTSLSEVIAEPFMLSLDTALARVKVQAMNDVKNYVRLLGLMTANPEVAAEVLTGAATNTVYAFKGSARSVESAQQTYGAYAKSLEYILRNEHSTTNGQNLFDFYSNRENWQEIQEALIKYKHGEDVQANTDAARVAKHILDQEASLTDQLKRYGANYDIPSLYVKKEQIQYIDAVIDNGEMLSSLDRVRGAINVLSTKANKKVSAILGSIESITNETHRKLIYWALRDFDLDRMFNRHRSIDISLNDLRDKMFKGDLSDLAERGDDVAKAFKYLVDRLAGTKVTKSAGGDGWVYKFLSGLHDLRAVASGQKAYAADAYDGALHFKDVDTELFAARNFGFKSAQESYARNFSQMFNAKYVLENFGSNPIQLAEELINTYNKLIVGDRDVAKRLQNLMGVRGDASKPYVSKMGITEGARMSILENIKLACGLQNQAPSAFARWMKVISQFNVLGLLASAGPRSLSDMATINEGLVLNSFAQGRLEAAATVGRASKVAFLDKDVAKLLMASNIINQEELLRLIANDPGFSLVGASKVAGSLEKAEAFIRNASNLVMNTIGRLEWFTNKTKSTAALAIQSSIGRNADTAWKDLRPNMQLALEREGFGEADWDFIRVHAVGTPDDYLKSMKSDKLMGDTSKWFIPQLIFNVPDEVFAKEMRARGMQNITPAEIAYFRQDLESKAWTMVETASSQFVSIPSGRHMVQLRGGMPRGSGKAIAWELGTQYMSFGVSMAWYTYGRMLSNAVARQAGISIFDVFNPRVQMQEQNRPAILRGLLASWMDITLATLAVNTMINISKGQIDSPIKPDGSFNMEPMAKAMFDAMGIMGTVGSAVMEGVMGSGLHGGGFSIQAFPAIANPLRVLYRTQRTLTSKNINDKPKALAAQTINEIARAMDIYNGPILAPVWQSLVGAYLDSLAVGGGPQYQQHIKNKERRGHVRMPWENDPRPIWERLQDF